MDDLLSMTMSPRLDRMNTNEITSTLVGPTPPKQSLSDYMLLILLVACICLGTPMSLMMIWRLMRRLHLSTTCGLCKEHRCTGANDFASSIRAGSHHHRGGAGGGGRRGSATPSLPRLEARRRYDWLKLQLNVADLMVLVFYAFSKVIWTMTYDWRGGETLCKLVRFLNVLSFHMCSNSVVCIGLERMIALLRPFPSARPCLLPFVAREYVMLSVSCTSAILLSLPQLWVWTVAEMSPDWHQCVTVWHEHVLTGALTDEETTLADLYNITHLVMIFWLPLAIIAMCYIVIVVHVILHLNETTVKEARAGSVRSHQYQDGGGGGTGGGGGGRADTTGGDGTVADDEIPSGEEVTYRRRRVSRMPSLFLSPTRRRLLVLRLLALRGRLKCGRLTKALCRQTLIVLTAYIVCWLPYNAFTLWAYFMPDHHNKYRTTVRFLQEMIVINSVINPFLYACDVYHQIVHERSRGDPRGCACSIVLCPCSVAEDSEASQQFL